MDFKVYQKFDCFMKVTLNCMKGEKDKMEDGGQR